MEDHISQNEQDFIGFKSDLLLEETGGDPIKRAGLINDMADTISLIPDAVVRAVYVQTIAAKFDIDEQILAERVGRSRTDMILSEQKQLERQKEAASRSQSRYVDTDAPSGEIPPPGYDDYPLADQMLPLVEPSVNGIEEPYLAPCERDLLKFILEEGCSPLQFDKDSKFYTEGETYTVAEFIDGILADDDASFMNTAYRVVYDEYFRLYDEGLSQQQIQTRLMNSMDPQIAEVSKDILIEKYQITVKNYEQSLTSVMTRLVQYIPKTLMTYQCKKVELILKDLTAELATAEDPDRQMEILEEMGNYNRIKARLNNELGRV